MKLLKRQQKPIFPYLDHAIDKKTVRSIKTDPNYHIRISTLKKIWDARNLKLSEFLIVGDET